MYALVQYDWIVHKKREIQRQTHTQRKMSYDDTQKGNGQVKMEAESKVMGPQARECTGLPEAGRGKAGSFLRLWRGHPVHTLILDFSPPELWENIFLFILNHLVCAYCYRNSSKLINTFAETIVSTVKSVVSCITHIRELSRVLDAELYSRVTDITEAEFPHM